ncbi:MAG: LysM peptidoglycan-binding domain-containing protein [Verrucomicrobiota bacterium]|nr:LysM peptidoglycan-binding domain-containing protein [Verrucomicrobiota bacterium]
MYLDKFISFSKILCAVLCVSFGSISCKSISNKGNSAKYNNNQSTKRFSLNPFGFKKRIGQDVFQIRNDLSQTNYRVSSLEGEVKTIQSSPVFSTPNYQTQNLGGQSTPSLTGKSHIVTGGETLSSISRQYKIGLDRLISENKILDPNALQIGQEIFIPPQRGQPATRRQEKDTSPVDPNADHHIVTGGDTLNRIAKRYGVSTDSIVSANSLDNPNNIIIGQRITLPVEPVQSPASTTNVPVEDLPKDEPEVTQNSNNPEEIVAPEGHGFYQVVDGDTLQSIAISFGTNADELKRLNKLSDDKNSLHIGDYILVPVPDDSLYES